jgi:hypothetical protein
MKNYVSWLLIPWNWTTATGRARLDVDYGAKKTIMIDDDVIHVPEGAGREI